MLLVYLHIDVCQTQILSFFASDLFLIRGMDSLLQIECPIRTQREGMTEVLMNRIKAKFVRHEGLS